MISVTLVPQEPKIQITIGIHTYVKTDGWWYLSSGSGKRAAFTQENDIVEETYRNYLGSEAIKSEKVCPNCPGNCINCKC